ncbi:MAG: hypothetical protein VB858_16125, partial [Planctomycetaceae bacterium]
MSNIRPSALQSDSPPQGPFSPLALIAIAAIALSVVLGGCLYFLSFLQSDNSTDRSTALQEVVMPDGSRLALEAVTWGNLHEHIVKYETHSVFRSTMGMHSLRHHTSDERIVLWFSCRNASGIPRDFSWWSHLSAVTPDGKEMRDSDDGAGQNITGPYGSFDESSGRPLPEAFASDGAQIIAWSTIKPLRHDGDTFPVRLYDRAGNLVGTFDIPDPSPINGRYPDWEPEELPITKDLGDGLLVTLTSLRGELEKQQHNPTNLKKRIRSTFTFTENGQSISGKWRAGSTQLRDALGNRCHYPVYYRDELSDTEATWLLSCLIHCNPEETFFNSSEKWTSGEIKLAEAGQRTAVGRKVTIAGAELEIIATGGSGKIAHKVLYPANQGSGRISAGDIYVIEVPSQDGPNGLRRITVESELPHVVFQCSSPPPQPDIIALKSVDQNGRPITLHGPAGNVGSGAPRVYFLTRGGDDDSQEPIQSVNITFAVSQPRTAEFFLRAPEFRKPALAPRKIRSQQQLLTEATRLITHYEAKLEQTPNNASFNNNLAWAVATAPQAIRTPDRIQQALRCAERACRSEPENEGYANTLGMLLLRQEKPAQAAEQFRRGHLSAHDLYGLSMTEFQAGAEGAAERFYRQGLDAHRMDTRLRSRDDIFYLLNEAQTLLLGESPQKLLTEINTLMDDGKTRDALQVLDQVLEVQDYNAWQWYRSACLNLHLGNTENWQRCCRTLIAEFRDSDDPYTLNRIGKACLLTDVADEFQDETRRCLARANAIAPDNAWIVLSLALQDLRNSRHAEALASARRALTFEELVPTASVPLNSVIAMSAFRLGDQAAATAALTRASIIRKEQFPHLSGKPMGQQWPAILVAERIYSEAETLISNAAGE